MFLQGKEFMLPPCMHEQCLKSYNYNSRIVIFYSILSLSGVLIHSGWFSMISFLGWNWQDILIKQIVNFSFKSIYVYLVIIE